MGNTSIDEKALYAVARAIAIAQRAPASYQEIVENEDSYADKLVPYLLKTSRAAIEAYEAAKTEQPVECAPEVMEFAHKVVEAAALCNKAWEEMQARLDKNTQFGKQSKEYHDAYSARDEAVNERYRLLRDNHKLIEQMAVALVLAPKRE